jgi:hypothetical protein
MNETFRNWLGTVRRHRTRTNAPEEEATRFFDHFVGVLPHQVGIVLDWDKSLA